MPFNEKRERKRNNISEADALQSFEIPVGCVTSQKNKMGMLTGNSWFFISHSIPDLNECYEIKQAVFHRYTIVENNSSVDLQGRQSYSGIMVFHQQVRLGVLKKLLPKYHFVSPVIAKDDILYKFYNEDDGIYRDSIVQEKNYLGDQQSVTNFPSANLQCSSEFFMTKYENYIAQGKTPLQFAFEFPDLSKEFTIQLLILANDYSNALNRRILPVEKVECVANPNASIASEETIKPSCTVKNNLTQSDVIKNITSEILNTSNTLSHPGINQNNLVIGTKSLKYRFSQVFKRRLKNRKNNRK